MTKEKLCDIENIITPILEKYKITRNSDKLLYLKVLNDNGFDINISLKDYLINNSYPSYESICRCRRKIQEKRKDLCGTKRIKKIRKETEKEYIKYAKGDNK